MLNLPQYQLSNLFESLLTSFITRSSLKILITPIRTWNIYPCRSLFSNFSACPLCYFRNSMILGRERGARPSNPTPTQNSTGTAGLLQEQRSTHINTKTPVKIKWITLRLNLDAMDIFAFSFSSSSLHPFPTTCRRHQCSTTVFFIWSCLNCVFHHRSFWMAGFDFKEMLFAAGFV